jgi:hypothetical protein
MVKRKKLKGGTSLKELQEFVNSVKIDIPYVETDDSVTIGQKISKLLIKKPEYDKKLNKIYKLNIN